MPIKRWYILVVGNEVTWVANKKIQKVSHSLQKTEISKKYLYF